MSGSFKDDEGESFVAISKTFSRTLASLFEDSIKNFKAPSATLTLRCFMPLAEIFLSSAGSS